MNIIIAGSRKIGQKHKKYIFSLLDLVFKKLDLPKEEKIIIFSGKCYGMDALGEPYAKQNSWEVKDFYADWNRLGKAAGPIRNQEMIDSDAHLLICFYLEDSVGSKDIISRAKVKNIRTIDLKLQLHMKEKNGKLY
ncbi:MAG: SLOG family protein [Nanoarchaeota archaeon]